MVILLEILNTTHPNLIPRREISEEESWDNREKPLTKPERAAKGVNNNPIAVVNDPVHVSDVDPYPTCVAPSSACIPSMLLPDKKLSQSKNVNKRRAERPDNLPRGIKPGFMNPAFNGDFQSGMDSIELEPIGSKSIAPTTSPDDLQYTSPSKALPKYLTQLKMDGAFDSKESADSGISKGSMVHQSSNEDNRDECYSSPNSERSSVVQVDLMQGRSALDASERRRIFHQESIKNRSKVVTKTPNENNRPAVECSPVVIVHSESSANEDLLSAHPNDFNPGKIRESEYHDKFSDTSPFVVIGSPEAHSCSSSVNSSFFVIQRSDGVDSLSIRSNELLNADVNSNKIEQSPDAEIGNHSDYQSLKNITETAQGKNESVENTAFEGMPDGTDLNKNPRTSSVDTQLNLEQNTPVNHMHWSESTYI